MSRPRLPILTHPSLRRTKKTVARYPSRLPRPLILGETHASRLRNHYHTTLADDLLYLNYTHTFRPLPDPHIHLPPRPSAAADPYDIHRPAPRLKGAGILRPNPQPPTPAHIPKLERIILHAMLKSAIGNFPELLAPQAAFRAIAGTTHSGGNIRGALGVQLVKATHGAQQWRLRKNAAIGVKADIRGPAMYTFLETLTEFVLPRLREFQGLPIPPASSSPNTPSNMSGVVAFGFPPHVLSLFPQVEVNFDSYPKMTGFHVLIVTNQKGRGAQDRARQLLSGFRVPFIRR